MATIAVNENFIGHFSGDKKDWKPFFNKAYAKVKNLLPELHPCGLLPEFLGPEICQQDEEWEHGLSRTFNLARRPRSTPCTKTAHLISEKFD